MLATKLLRTKNTYRILFLIYVICLITLLVMPTDGEIKLYPIIFGIETDKLIHVSLFIPFIPLTFLNNWHRFTSKGMLKSYLKGILFCALCESLHYFIPYRDFDLRDFLANCIGLSIGVSSFFFNQKLKKIYPSFR